MTKSIIIRDDIQDLLDKERAWRARCDQLDSGSYCENASPEYTAAANIVRLYEALGTALLQFERTHRA